MRTTKVAAQMRTWAPGWQGELGHLDISPGSAVSFSGEGTCRASLLGPGAPAF